MKLFGKAKPAAAVGSGGPNSAQDALQALNHQEQLLVKRTEFLELKVKAEIQEAVKFKKAKNNKRAIACLKRKKMIEAQMDNVDNMLQNIVTQKNALENAAFNKEHVGAQRVAMNALKQMNKEITPEKVDELNDEMQELMDDMNQVTSALAHQLDSGVNLDEDELEAELEALEQDQLDEEWTGNLETEAPAMSFPEAPEEKPTLIPAAAAGAPFNPQP